MEVFDINEDLYYCRLAESRNSESYSTRFLYIVCVVNIKLCRSNGRLHYKAVAMVMVRSKSAEIWTRKEWLKLENLKMD